jgi:hypothetical protein
MHLRNNRERKEANVKRTLALIVALGVIAMAGSVTLVSAECPGHKTQAAIDKADTSRPVATAPATDKTDASQLRTAQVDKPAQPTAEVKK